MSIKKGVVEVVEVKIDGNRILINGKFFGEVIDRKRVSLQDYPDYIAIVNNKTRGILVIIWKTI